MAATDHTRELQHWTARLHKAERDHDLDGADIARRRLDYLIDRMIDGVKT